jgi:hypothetical protein
MGRETLAPLLHDFVRWLHETARADGVQRLLFLARDGYMLQRAYQAVIPAAEQLPNQYVFASRRLFNFPAIQRVDEVVLEFLMGDRVEMPVREYLARIGLDDEAALREPVRAAGFTGLGAMVRRDDEGKLRGLFMSLEPQIVQAAQLERRRLVAYVEDLADWHRERVGVIDIGWHGSLQVSLRRMLGLPAEQLFGYYFGLERGVRARRTERMRAYLDEEIWRDVWTCWRTFRRCREIFEVLLSEQDGSIIGLRQRGRRFTAVRDAYAMPVNAAARLRLLQESAMAALPQSAMSRGEVRRRLRRLLSRPSVEQAVALGDIPHMEGFGGYGRLEAIARPRRRRVGYVQHPGDLVWELRKTFWRSGFMRRLRSGR